ncbi:hypothetical protein ACF3DV_13465 [Chlorogloeopsis fritschii PCC 9212]|uniref:Uncharacterized protein n=1 Tax=Chlorogloeopsis fritschii PCC 6912 TaxID=211165 RepID=A0A3S1A3H5_CHLFR|nr:hypothetical protein [Chlorogloeopsis fritschii]RUR86829.1 hypothetical protein PCC6912_02720 [Chlorogloeopsis fritschii PCC 6912]
MLEEKSSQSMSFSGGQFSGVQFGQAGRDLAQIQHNSQDDAEKQLTPDDVVELIGQIETLFWNSGLPGTQKEKAIKHLETAKEEVKAIEPDKDFAVKSLERATKVLKDAGDTVVASQGLWQKLEPIAKQLAPWFGIAAKTLLGL